MRRKNIYIPPSIDILQTNIDIITYSETEEWIGPGIDVGNDEMGI